MTNITIDAIAKATGFSKSTVSRVLNGNAKKYRISPKTISIIEKEAKISNYSPSLIARSLRMKKTYTIGLLLPNIDNPFFANIASVIIKETGNSGYTIILGDSQENEQNEIKSIDSLTSRNIDGAIIIPCGENVKHIDLANKRGTPIVLIDRYFEGTILPYVSTDNYLGASMAIEYLIKKGHKDIACIQGVESTMPTKQRVRGYKDVMVKNNLADFISVTGSDFSVENGYIETKKLLKRKTIPTAIFAQSNTIVLGAYKAIKEANLKIPENISVICFDDHLYLNYIEPIITRIAQPIGEISALATQILINNIEKDEKEVAQILLPPTLIEGDSVLKL